MNKLLLCCTFSLAALTGIAHAETGPYVEFNMGYSATGSSSINQTQELIQQEDNHFGYNLNAGVLFLGFGAEAGYTRFADLKYHDNTDSAPTDLYGLHLAAKLVHDLGPLFLMGKLGYGQLHQGNFSVNDVKVDSEQKSGLYFGVGGGIKFTPTLAAVVQYQQIQGGDDVPTADLTSIGINWTL